ncbi:MAG: glycosyltransferase family 2 protein [Blautia sp.]
MVDRDRIVFDNLTDRQISVIIPVYNCRNYLRQAVKSVVEQTYQEIRIILVDDGSTDGSSALCDELANQYARVTALHQENGGVASARNKGMEYVLSSGQNGYFAFLDADDVWAPNCIDDHISKLMEQNIDLIGLQSCLCNQSLTRRSAPAFMQEGEHQGGVSSIWIYAKQHIGAMLYRIDFIRHYEILFYNIKFSEDKIFCMQCLYLADRIYLKNQLLYFYRQNVASAIHTRKKGIPFFGAFIDAYIKSDFDMARWKNEIRGELNEGKLLAKIYIMDMAEEEYESRDGAKRIRELLEQRPEYRDIAERTTGSVQVDERWVYMKSHEWELVVKNRVRGFVNKLMRSVYYLPLVKKYVDRKRYPIEV